MSDKKEKPNTLQGEGQHFIPITNDEKQLQAFSELYRQGITKEQITLILSTVRLNFEVSNISPQPLLDSLSAYQQK